MKNYVAIHKKSDHKINLTYDTFGVLVKIEFAGERWKPETINWIFQPGRLPLSESEIWHRIENKALEFDYMEIPTDLSFSNFWNLFANKKGKIPSAQRFWEKLTDAEKIEALLYIPKLHAQKKADGTALPYPQTYISGKYWLAEKI
ncbi:hypothetical protein [Elizabethkingia anophelis]|uniref:hypothetical protein n=1 Tax=Elizabethkingia anophelis TaxID=1117645 RepID=UPI0024685299|nr:hypothetical protein [Elizabethkingia anophelis]MDV3711207.1 hypothetical protein [Elizabethkingia anophelis]MDV3766806.1 hypothetical protein [Elizabethkingia anophelis]MDV3945146.1 hypothetical protein [Elizabethkingia anophelis]WGL71006.1 hypothetical protein QFB79_06530 [Elizabethkingia anophelis]